MFSMFFDQLRKRIGISYFSSSILISIKKMHRKKNHLKVRKHSAFFLSLIFFNQKKAIVIEKFNNQQSARTNA